MAFLVGCYATPVEVLHLADLLTLERLGEARAVWGLVVETLLCGVSLSYRICIQSHVGPSWSKLRQSMHCLRGGFRDNCPLRCSVAGAIVSSVAGRISCRFMCGGCWRDCA